MLPESFFNDSLIYVPILSAIFAGIGLMVNAFSLNRNRETRELQLAESIVKDLRELEREFYDKYERLDENGRSKWDHLFFNTLEWFSFLINSKKIKDKKIITFFGPAIIKWYDGIFLAHNNESVIEDPNQFEELKTLYKKLKIQNI